MKYLWMLLLCNFIFAQSNKGIDIVPVKDQSGNKVLLYQGSYALLIGVSNYTAGWPDLESIPGELRKIEFALAKNGFKVKKIISPNSLKLKKAFESFIDQYGYAENNRLLFFYSGHGYSRKGKGYLVPTDAPDPRKNKTNFLRKALRMGQIISWSRDIEAKHAIFLFDSCFSGTIFKAKALPKIPPHISSITSRPVRQYISAGSAGEEVPAKSVFAPSFTKGLRGEADLNNDGYITGTELGMYLHDKVVGYRTGQTPQYGKIKDPDLDEGDFVFKLKEAKVPEAKKFPTSGWREKVEKRKRKKWKKYEQVMEKGYKELKDLDNNSLLSAEEKVEAWESFFKTYTANNPYSKKDDQIRNYCTTRIKYWGKKQKLSQKKEITKSRIL